jgi:hypothetical protein
MLVLLFAVVSSSPLKNVNEKNVKRKSASCSSLSSLLVQQDEEESLDLFIFQD